MSEAGIMRQWMLKLTEMGWRIFRNNVGCLRAEDGRYVDFGLCVGSSDLIGWQSVDITPEMVGRKVAVFTAVEVKGPRGRLEKAQANFLRRVKEAGGVAMIARENGMEEI